MLKVSIQPCQICLDTFQPSKRPPEALQHFQARSTIGVSTVFETTANPSGDETKQVFKVPGCRQTDMYFDGHFIGI